MRSLKAVNVKEKVSLRDGEQKRVLTSAKENKLCIEISTGYMVVGTRVELKCPIESARNVQWTRQNGGPLPNDARVVRGAFVSMCTSYCTLVGK